MPQKSCKFWAQIFFVTIYAPFFLVPIQGERTPGGAAGQQGVVQSLGCDSQIYRCIKLPAQLLGLDRDIQGRDWAGSAQRLRIIFHTLTAGVCALTPPVTSAQVGFRHHKDYQAYIWAKGEHGTQVCHSLNLSHLSGTTTEFWVNFPPLSFATRWPFQRRICQEMIVNTYWATTATIWTALLDYQRQFRSETMAYGCVHINVNCPLRSWDWLSMSQYQRRVYCRSTQTCQTGHTCYSSCCFSVFGEEKLRGSKLRSCHVEDVAGANLSVNYVSLCMRHLSADRAFFCTTSSFSVHTWKEILTSKSLTLK